ncbi:hypothetical protein H9P43_008020 [Blastocladiella emersonii ATCC 22665]|nr:hypothetical protein H9P43_008020 [Blastocladiella emersonii ATCC 22665]
MAATTNARRRGSIFTPPPARLRYLNVSFLKGLQLRLLASPLPASTVAAALAHITHLNLSGTDRTDTWCTAVLPVVAPRLIRLALAWNTHLTDQTLAALAQHGPKRLTHLDLTHCRDITDVGLAQLARHAPALRVLSLAWCTRISRRTLHAALSYWPHLRAISVVGARASQADVRDWWGGFVDADTALRQSERWMVQIPRRAPKLLINFCEVAFYLDI